MYALHIQIKMSEGCQIRIKKGTRSSLRRIGMKDVSYDRIINGLIRSFQVNDRIREILSFGVAGDEYDAVKTRELSEQIIELIKEKYDGKEIMYNELKDNFSQISVGFFLTTIALLLIEGELIENIPGWYHYEDEYLTSDGVNFARRRLW